MKKDFKSVFLDTAIFIYMLEDHQEFAGKVESFLKYCHLKNLQLTTSVITFLEFGVKPYRENRIDLIEGFKDLIEKANINISEITLRDCDIASQLRGKYEGLKAFDALQVSVYLKENCDIFMGNDKRIKVIKEINSFVLDDWDL